MATGAAIRGNPPVIFSETKNLKWKSVIPGKGHSTPVVWGDRIIVTTAVATTQKQEVPADQEKAAPNPMSPNRTEFIHEFKVIMLDRRSGKIIWDKTVATEKPAEWKYGKRDYFGSSKVFLTLTNFLFPCRYCIKVLSQLTGAL